MHVLQWGGVVVQDGQGIVGGNQVLVGLAWVRVRVTKTDVEQQEILHCSGLYHKTLLKWERRRAPSGCRDVGM